MIAGRIVFIIASVAFALTSSPVRGGSETPKPVDVCQAIASAAKLSGQYLSVRGDFEKGTEYTDLSSPHCRKAIAIRATDAASDDPGFKAILAVYYCPPFQSRTKHISGDFIGRFEWKPGRIPEWLLHVDRVSHVHIEVESCGLP